MPNQAHICIAITKSDIMGGAQKYVLTLASELTKRGHKVTVLAGGDGVLFDHLTTEGIDFIKLKSSQRDISIGKEFALLRELYATFKKIRPDVLHLNSSKMGVVGALIGRMAGIRSLIFTAHGWAFNESRPAWQKAVFYFLYWITVMLCTKTICVSKKTKEQIESLPGMRSRTTVVYNGVHAPNFYSHEEARSQLARQFPFLDLQKKWISVLAELHPIKGHDILIEAISDNPLIFENYQIVCMGTGQDADRLKALVSQKNLDLYVFFTGYLSEASRYLKAFEMNVLPSRSEALPLAILESGLAGTLVIASAVGGIPEVVDDSVSGFLFDRENSTELAQKLSIAVSLDEDRSHSLRAALSQKIERGFSVSAMTDQTLDAYGLKQDRAGN